MKITEWNKSHKDYFPVGEGWRPLVEKLVKDIAKIAPYTDISQIKEKFGTLRFYCSGDGRDDIGDLISKAEIESGKTCEHCGSRWFVTTSGGWLLTLCWKCRLKRKVAKIRL